MVAGTASAIGFVRPWASALIISVPRRKPLSTRTGMRPPTASMISGKTSIVARPLSTTRPLCDMTSEILGATVGAAPRPSDRAISPERERSARKLAYHNQRLWTGSEKLNEATARGGSIKLQRHHQLLKLTCRSVDA